MGTDLNYIDEEELGFDIEDLIFEEDKDSLTVQRDPKFEEITKGVALYLLNLVRRLIQLDEVLVCFLCNKTDDGHFWLWEEPKGGYEAVLIMDPRGMLAVSALHEGLHVIFPAMNEKDIAYLTLQILDLLSEDQIYNFLVDILEKMEIN